MLSGGEISRKLLKHNYADAIVSYGFTILIFAQAMLVILGSCNVIPLAGLPIPFLSRGSSYQAIIFSFCAILLYLSMFKPDNTEEIIETGGEDNEERN